MSYRLIVNGTPHLIEPKTDGESLLAVLREQLGLTGTKGACEQGECGSCSVMLDDRLVCSCLVLAEAAAGASVRTVESLSPDGTNSDVQQAFVDAGAVQCGYCTPGLIVAVHDLLDRSPTPDELEVRESLAGNLCRCTGYGRVLEAVRIASARRTAGARSAR